jgi:hypothetical protein
LYTNTPLEIKSLGFGIGLSRKVYKDFEVGVKYYAEFNFDQSEDPSFEAGFNTKHRVKASLVMKNYLKTLVSMLVEDITPTYGNLQWLTV